MVTVNLHSREKQTTINPLFINNALNVHFDLILYYLILSIGSIISLSSFKYLYLVLIKYIVIIIYLSLYIFCLRYNIMENKGIHNVVFIFGNIIIDIFMPFKYATVVVHYYISFILILCTSSVVYLIIMKWTNSFPYWIRIGNIISNILSLIIFTQIDEYIYEAHLFNVAISCVIINEYMLFYTKYLLMNYCTDGSIAFLQVIGQFPRFIYHFIYNLFKTQHQEENIA